MCFRSTHPKRLNMPSADWKEGLFRLSQTTRSFQNEFWQGTSAPCWSHDPDRCPLTKAGQIFRREKIQQPTHICPAQKKRSYPRMLSVHTEERRSNAGRVTVVQALSPYSQSQARGSVSEINQTVLYISPRSSLRFSLHPTALSLPCTEARRGERGLLREPHKSPHLTPRCSCQSRGLKSWKPTVQIPT